VRQWATLVLHVVLLLAGLGLLQVVAERTNRRIDLTRTRDLSLAPVTEQVLRELQRPVHLTAFYRRGTRESRAALLERMRRTSPYVEYELLDLDRHPERARVYGIAQYDRVAIECEGRRAIVPAVAEEPIVGGILRVVRGRTRRLVFTTGHGERAPGGGAEGYGRLVTALGDEDWRAESVSLYGADLPDDTALLVVAGPRHDFLESEVARVAAYLKRGGRALFLFEPGPLPNLSGFLASMGIRLGDDVVVDHERSVVGTDGLAAVVELFKRGNPVSEPDGHTIESGAVLPSARSVDVARAVPGVDADSIARTGPTAWAMADLDRARRGEQPARAAGDVPGGASVVVMAELGDAEAHGRLVVVGDADFASDAYIDLLGNRDLVLNAGAWVADDATLAGERGREASDVFRPLSPLVITEGQARALLATVAVGEPALVLVAGAVLVGVRRRRG
jgi:gliding motility-associatede transport system auxiliary component